MSKSSLREEESLSDYSGSYSVYKREKEKESDEEYHSADDDDDDEDDIKTLKSKLARERESSKRTTQQMRTLMEFIEQYKKTVEAERNVIEEKAKREEQEHKLKEKNLLEKIKDLEDDYDEMIDEYENKIFEIGEEKKARNKENVENLQTLLKELNYIEESNENLTVEIDKYKETNEKLSSELKLSKELIVQLERKLKQQEHNSIRASRESLSSETIQLELQKERTKVQNIASLLTQMRMIVASDSNNDDMAATSQLLTEKEEHSKTKQALEEQGKHVADLKMQVEKLQKRIKDLHSTTLRQIHADNNTTSSFTYPVPDPKQVGTNRSSLLRKFSDKKNANSNQLVTEEKIQSMFIYAEQGKLDDLQKLLKKTKGLVHAVDEIGRTALHRAALNGVKPAILQLFLENGISPNIQDIHGMSVFHCAAKCPLDNTENMKLLSKRQDVDVHLVTTTNETVLHIYAKGKYLNTEVFTNIASKFNDLNLADNEGDTIMHCACHENHDQAVVNLIKYGANANLTNSKGETPLHVAARHGYMKIVQILVDLGGADPCVIGDRGTPLDVAMVGSPIPAFLETAMKRRNSPRRSRATIAVEHSTLGPVVDIKENKSLAAVQSVPVAEAPLAIPQLIVPSTTDPTAATTSLRIRSTSIFFDNRIPITINSPDMTFKTSLSLNNTVQDALNSIRKKFPDNCKDYVLMFGDQVMDTAAKLGDYPKLKEVKELSFLSKEAAINVTGMRSFSTYGRNSIA